MATYSGREQIDRAQAALDRHVVSPSVFADRLRALRIARGLSLRRLGRLVHYSHGWCRVRRGCTRWQRRGPAARGEGRTYRAGAACRAATGGETTWVRCVLHQPDRLPEPEPPIRLPRPVSPMTTGNRGVDGHRLTVAPP